MRHLTPPLAAAIRRHRQPFSTAAAAASTPPPSPAISAAELADIAGLLPRLLAGGHLAATIRLLSAALLLRPPIPSLPFPDLAAHLTREPSLSAAMALLTSFHHHPLKPSPLPLASPLLADLLRLRRATDAATVLRWLCRDTSLHRPDAGIYRIAVEGFVRLERAKEALVAVKEMALDQIVIGDDLRRCVREGLMQDARIDEARELDAAMKCAQNGEGFGKVVDVTDRLLAEWEE